MTEIVQVSSLKDATAKAALRVNNGNTKPFLLSCIPPEELIERMDRVRHGVFDFDDTLATGNQHQELRSYLPKEISDFDLDVLNWILREDKSFQGVPSEKFWWFDAQCHQSIKTAVIEAFFIGMNVGTMRALRISKSTIQMVSERMVAREGAGELFKRLQKTCIITYGFEEVVRLWAERLGIQTQISGVVFTYDDQDCLTGACPSSLVVGQTKGFVAQDFRIKHEVVDQGILTLGDRPFDIEMMYDHPRAVNALIFEPEQALTRFASFDISENRERFKRVSCVLISDSLQPLVDLLHPLPIANPANEFADSEITKPV